MQVKLYVLNLLLGEDTPIFKLAEKMQEMQEYKELVSISVSDVAQINTFTITSAPKK